MSPVAKENPLREQPGHQASWERVAPRMSGFPEYSDYDATGLAGLVRKKEVHPAELVDEVFMRIERINPEINAVVTLMRDAAEEEARLRPDGPFGGVPILLKDAFFECAGAPLSNGSRFFRDYVPDFDAELITRIKRAGLIIVGKTNVPEFALSPHTEPELFGPCLNPWDVTRTQGGSSGGSAAAIAARIVPMAQASDGGGSIRIPASCCALFGLKPTRARTPTGPSDIDALHGALVGHAISISVRDSALLLDALAGPEPGAVYWAPPPKCAYAREVEREPGRLRIAYTASPFMGHRMDPECLAALDRTVTLMRELGHEVSEATPDLDRDPLLGAMLIVTTSLLAADIGKAERELGRRATSRDFEPQTWLMTLFGRHHSGAEYVEAYRTIRSTGPMIARFFQEYDVRLTPTLATPPLPIGWSQPHGIDDFIARVEAAVGSTLISELFGAFRSTLEEIFDFAPYTTLFNFTGNPAMSVPLEWSSGGLPIGMHFAARYGDEATLFGLAAQLEQARPWQGLLPPVHA